MGRWVCGVTVGTLLTTVAMQVVENKVCDQQYASRYCHGNRRITQNDMLCAGGEGQGSCYVSPVMSPPPTQPLLTIGCAQHPFLSSGRL